MAPCLSAVPLGAVIVAALIRGLCAGGLRSGTLHLKGDAFDPADPETRKLLNEALGLDLAIDISALAENAGLNGGVWALRDPAGVQGELIMKLRPRLPDGSRSSEFLPEEAEHFENLAQDFPSIDGDHGVVFPTDVLACFGASGASAPRVADVILMRRAPGLTLAFLIHDLAVQKDSELAMKELIKVFGQVGTHLANFHVRYEGAQHNDMQQSNIIVDRDNDHRITLIDLGTMGVPIAASDVRHFNNSLAGLSALYPTFPFWKDGYAAFENSYYAQFNRAMGMATTWEDAAPTFQVSVPVTVGEDPGLEVIERAGGLFVASVADGPIARWNLHNPVLQVLSGQKVLELNGAVSTDDVFSNMLGRLKGRYIVGDHVDVWSSSRGRWFLDGKVTKVDDMIVEVEYRYQDGKSLGKVLAYNSFELRLHGNGGVLTLSLERMIPTPSEEL